MNTLLAVAAAMGSSWDEAVERCSRLAQHESAQQSTLPREMPLADREWLEDMGFVFGDDVDALFVSVKFPPGWQKRTTAHYMWTDLVGPDGGTYGQIFYKPDPWDRSAFFSLIVPPLRPGEVTP